MGYIRWIAPVLFVLAATQWVRAGSIAPDLVYSQDGIHFTPLPALGKEMALQAYYRPIHGGGRPLFGTSANTETIAMYWDQSNDTLSLLMVGGNTKQNSGRAKFKIDGLPQTESLSLKDKAHKLHILHGTGAASVTLDSVHGVAGVGIDGLENEEFSIDVSLQSSNRAIQWRLATGNTATARAGFIPLNVDAPLIIESIPPAARRHQPFTNDSGSTPGDGLNTGGTTGNGVGDPVPEPFSVGWIVLATFFLYSRPRRKSHHA